MASHPLSSTSQCQPASSSSERAPPPPPDSSCCFTTDTRRITVANPPDARAHCYDGRLLQSAHANPRHIRRQRQHGSSRPAAAAAAWLQSSDRSRRTLIPSTPQPASPPLRPPMPITTTIIPTRVPPRRTVRSPATPASDGTFGHETYRCKGRRTRVLTMPPANAHREHVK